jgi:hypothetical protein
MFTWKNCSEGQTKVATSKNACESCTITVLPAVFVFLVLVFYVLVSDLPGFQFLVFLVGISKVGSHMRLRDETLG